MAHRVATWANNAPRSLPLMGNDVWLPVTVSTIEPWPRNANFLCRGTIESAYSRERNNVTPAKRGFSRQRRLDGILQSCWIRTSPLRTSASRLTHSRPSVLYTCLFMFAWTHHRTHQFAYRCLSIYRCVSIHPRPRVRNLQRVSAQNSLGGCFPAARLPRYYTRGKGQRAIRQAEVWTSAPSLTSSILSYWQYWFF